MKPFLAKYFREPAGIMGGFLIVTVDNGILLP
jgi:hypothetical protein